jgi:hypothetical protein
MIKRRHQTWLALLVFLILFGCATPGVISVSHPEFQEGMTAYAHGDYKRAELIFNQIIAKYVGSPFLAEAQWMMARSIEGQLDLERAVTQYQLFVRNYPTHPHRSAADLKIAELEEKLYPWRKSRQVHLAAVLNLSNRFTLSALERWFYRFEKAGVDTLVIKVFHTGSQEMSSGVFFQTLHAPVLMDALATWARTAHRYHLRVFAWMSVRQMEWKLRSNPKWADLKYDPRHMSLMSSEMMDLFQPAVRDYIMSLYQDLASYSIEGILFGDDLFYKAEEGLGEVAQQQFIRDFGESFSPKVLRQAPQIGNSSGVFWRWVGWKSRQIFYFLDELKQAVRKANPSIQLGVFLSEDAVLNPVQALARNSQDLLEAKRLMLDYYVIDMNLSQAQDISKAVSARVSQVLVRANQLMGKSDNVLVGIHDRGDASFYLNQGLSSELGLTLPKMTQLSALAKEMGSEFSGLLFNPEHFQ